MSWGEKRKNQHIKAAEALEKIKNEAFSHIKQNTECTELEVYNYILKRYKHYGLKSVLGKAIVAFNESAATPHYDPRKNPKKLRKNSLILIDIWGRLEEPNSPYADITWMGYCGEVPKKIDKAFKAVLEARNNCLEFIREEALSGKLQKGKQAEKVTIDTVKRKGYKGYKKDFLHTTGHSIGFHSPHGRKKGIRKENKEYLEYNLGYTIEPGLYFKNEFGIRSEIDFYINDNGELIVTTEIQKEWVRI